MDTSSTHAPCPGEWLPGAAAGGSCRICKLLEPGSTLNDNIFAQAIQKTGIDLPGGQWTHVLRHTFAGHCMINGGNILVLHHQAITMTMR